MATTPAPSKGFDPEAEQEVDFARYARMLVRRWWLILVGVVAGAVIGYLVSLGGAQVYSATATVYLGQPYNGTTLITALQTNPSVPGQIANAQVVDAKVATQCSTSIESFRKGLSVQKIAASSTPSKGTAQISPLVTVTVQASKGKVAACAANALAHAIVRGIWAYPKSKIFLFQKHVTADNDAIKSINAAIADPSVATTDKAVLGQSLRADQADLYTAQIALLVAKSVEMPKVTIPAAARQVTAQSSHNTVTIAALIGLLLGILGALLWDRIVPPRHGS